MPCADGAGAQSPNPFHVALGAGWAVSRVVSGAAVGARGDGASSLDAVSGRRNPKGWDGGMAARGWLLARMGGG